YSTDGTRPGTRIVPSAVTPLQSQPYYASPTGVQSFLDTFYLTATTRYAEVDPFSLALVKVTGGPSTLWRANDALTSASLVRTPSGMGAYLRTPLVQSDKKVIGIGGDDFDPYGEVVYLESF